MRHAIVIIISLYAAACIDEPCDPGQTFAAGLCVIVPPDARVADARDGDAAAEARSVPFDTVCTATAQCGGVTNFCAIVPGELQGFCTHDGCVEDLSVCPPDVGCLDLTPLGAPGMSICYGDRA